MVAGETRELTFRLRNNGSRAWAAAGHNPVHLAYNWFTPDGHLAGDWDTFRASLPLNVNAGQQVTVTPVYLKVPSTTGDYILRWDLVEEGGGLVLKGRESATGSEHRRGERSCRARAVVGGSEP